ncbi:hypothetical protein [Metabacillus sp. SLBN-84]
MARKKRSLSGAFEKAAQENETGNSNTETITKDVTQERNTSTVTPSETKNDEDLLAGSQEASAAQETIHGNGTGNSNTETLTKDVTQERNTAAVTPSETKNERQKPAYIKETPQHEAPVRTIREVTESLMNMYDAKSKKKTVEETHTRATFLFRTDLQKRLDNLANGKRGFKTMFLNKAIEALLDEMEDAQR